MGLHLGAVMALAGNTLNVESMFLKVIFSWFPLPSPPHPMSVTLGNFISNALPQTQRRVSLSWPQRRPWHTFRTLRGGEGRGRPWRGRNLRALGSPGPLRPSVGPTDSA